MGSIEEERPLIIEEALISQEVKLYAEDGSVYKGYGWPKGAEELVSSFGIKNALFSVNASYVKDDAFGKLIPCPVQQPSDTNQEEDSGEELSEEESRAIWKSLKKESKGYDPQQKQFISSLYSVYVASSTFLEHGNEVFSAKETVLLLR